MENSRWVAQEFAIYGTEDSLPCSRGLQCITSSANSINSSHPYSAYNTMSSFSLHFCKCGLYTFRFYDHDVCYLSHAIAHTHSHNRSFTHSFSLTLWRSLTFTLSCSPYLTLSLCSIRGTESQRNADTQVTTKFVPFVESPLSCSQVPSKGAISVIVISRRNGRRTMYKAPF
jgi:hypothetical protein